MQVIIAKKAGFCMGVRRAVDMTLDMVNRQEGHISTFGPLIHNPQVLDVLKDKGVGVLDAIPEQDDGTVIIRAHGVPPSRKKALQDSGLEVKDATCPRVVKVQAIINRYKKEGKTTVIIGDLNHAEVEGLMGYAGNGAHVVSNEAEARALKLDNSYIIVSQTTQDEASFEEMVNIIMAANPGGQVFNTICDSTHKRQDEVRKLCAQVEALVVVGGRNSANTKRLGEIATGLGKEVFVIETEDELDPSDLSRFACVGVTAGASTPNWMINRVVRALEAIPGRGEGSAGLILYKLLWMLMATNLYVSLGGGLLAYACSFLQGIEAKPAHGLVAFGYLFAMHNLNRLTDQGAKIFNDPGLLNFCTKNVGLLLTGSIGGLGMALILTFGNGWPPFLLLLVMSVFGMLYSVRFIPKQVSAIVKVARLKEIPGSKTMFVALAWAMALVVLPAMEAGRTFTPQSLAAFFFVLFLVFVRNALYDVFEVQGDRIVGKETLPVFTGEKRTIRLLYIIMALLMVFVAGGMFGGILPGFAFLMLPGLLYLLTLTRLYEKGRFRNGVRLEFGLETLFLIIALPLWLGATLY